MLCETAGNFSYFYSCCLAICCLTDAADLVFWGPGFAPWATGLAVRPDDEVWVGTNVGIQVYNADGRYLRKLDRPTKNLGVIESIGL